MVRSRIITTFAEFAKGWRSPRDPTPEELARIQADIRTRKDELSQLEAREQEMSSHLRGTVQFEQILPTKAYKALHDQLFKNERVHPVASVEELVGNRIGGVDDNKRCFARVTPGKSPKLTAGIFTAMVDITPTDGDLNYRDIPGDIDAIKELPIEPFVLEGKGRTIAVILYTVSGNQEQSWDKGGRPLAGALHSFLNGQAEQQGFNLVLSTLSPIRLFGKWLSTQPGYEGAVNADGELSDEFADFLRDEASQDSIRLMTLKYLLTQRDPVMNFHLGNGAYIGDIKFNPDNGEDWVMINYVYPNDPEMLAQQKHFYEMSDMRVLAPHLQQILGYDAELQKKATVLPGPGLIH